MSSFISFQDRTIGSVIHLLRNKGEGVFDDFDEPRLMEQSQFNIIANDDFSAAGIQDEAKARQLILHLAGNGVSDNDVAPLIPLILTALSSSPDPDRSLSCFSRWFGSLGNPISHLLFLQNHPLALELFFQITGSSQYFAELFVRFPEYIELITNPGLRGEAKGRSDMRSQLNSIVDVCSRPELKRDALRRWKAREMLRIGIRDISGYADMPTTSFEFSNLADVCVQKALEIAVSESPLQADRNSIPFIVVGMGKLGGQELNYSSDIDLMFVHGDDLPEELIRADGKSIELLRYTSRLSEAIIKILGEDRPDGHVFRVDMRLRPEGRFGPLARSLESHRNYYENWAESWERQALLKARVIAGDAELGEKFMAILEPFVFRKNVSGEFLDDLRQNKRRIEKKCELEGGTLTNVKTGFGGIRDIEFLTQFLQLQYGGIFPQIRTQNTLEGLAKLREKSILSESEKMELSEDYIFLRNLEHRLQLLHGFQTQSMPPPADLRERYLLSRRMGYPNLEGFESELNRRRFRVRERLIERFYETKENDFASQLHTDVFEELAELLESIDLPEAQPRLNTLLVEVGFRNAKEAIRNLKMPISGNEYGRMPPDTALRFKRIAPNLLRLISSSPDPDAGLSGLEKLATAVPNRAHLYASFEDSPLFLTRLAKLASAAPYLFQRLVDNLEWLEAILPDDENQRASDDDDTLEKFQYWKRDIDGRVKKATGYEDKLKTIAKFYLRETLILGAMDVWGKAKTERTSSSLSKLAELILQALLDACRESIFHQTSLTERAKQAMKSVAIIGLGKLGGEELGHSSDWDVLFVYDPEVQTEAKEISNSLESDDIFQLANSLVQKILAAVKSLVGYGAPVEIDLRLRPWGKDGALIYTPQAFKAYFDSNAEMWERHAAMKARFVAGSADVGSRLILLMQSATFGRGITEEESQLMIAMKRRIETERLKSATDSTDLKLGKGGMTDVEWMVQKIQLTFASAYPQLTTTNTIIALNAAMRTEILPAVEVISLIDNYLFLTRLRNLLWLQSGHSHTSLLYDSYQARSLALLLGYGDTINKSAESKLIEELKAVMAQVRAIFNRRFYQNKPIDELTP